MGGREIFEQVRILPTISQIPASVSGGPARHSQVQLCREAVLEASGLVARHHVKGRWPCIKVLWYFSVEISSCTFQKIHKFTDFNVVLVKN